MIALVLAGAGVVAYIELAPRKPAAQAPLTPEARAYIGNLKLSDVGMKAAKNYFGQMVVEITGNIANVGDRSLDTVEIYCVFQDYYEQLTLRQRVAIVSPKTGGLKPGETTSFRLPFDNLPESWNQNMPQLVIASVKFN